MLQGLRLETLSVFAGYAGESAGTRLKLAVSIQSPLGQILQSFSWNERKFQNKVEVDQNLIFDSNKSESFSPLITRLFLKSNISTEKRTTMEIKTERKDNLLLKYSNKLFSVFLYCLNPCHVLSLRLWSVRLSGHLFEMLSHQLSENQEMKKQINKDIVIRIKSYSTRRKENENIVENDKNDKIRINNDLYNFLCEDVNEGIFLLINGLNDSSDVVRYSVLTALQHCVPFILQDQVHLFCKEYSLK